MRSGTLNITQRVRPEVQSFQKYRAFFGQEEERRTISPYFEQISLLPVMATVIFRPQKYTVADGDKVQTIEYDIKASSPVQFDRGCT